MSGLGSVNKQQPHALMFPYPAQGHINPMMQLAKRLLDAGFFITFVNTDHIHERIFSVNKGAEVMESAAAPNLRFEQIPDGLPEGHKRFHEKLGGVIETTVAILALPGPLAKLVRRIMSSNESPPLTCIIADAFCSWVQDVADLFQIPRIALWTTPVHASLAYFFMSTLQSQGLIPVKDESKLQEMVDCIDGVAPMKLEDYISFYLVDSPGDFLFQWFLRLGMKRAEEAAWNLGNNFEAWEHEACAAFKKEVPTFLPIGPLLPAIDAVRGTSHSAASAGILSLWPEDASCIEWISQHGKASVIYISFGSMVDMSEEEAWELIRGLEESCAPYLWAIRPDQDGGALAQLRERLDAEPRHRGRIVGWAPQLSILAHPSVGLFISHCGWNSITESVIAGVPILAKPGAFAEQRMNAHYIADVWKIGGRLPNGVSASEVKSLVGSLMGSSVEAARMQERLSALRQSALEGLRAPAGSSMCNLKRFTDDMYRRAAAPSGLLVRPQHVPAV